MKNIESISLNLIDITLLNKVPFEICQKYKILPLGRFKGKIYVGMEEIKKEYIRYLEQNLSEAIVPVKIDKENITKLIYDGFGVKIHDRNKYIEENIISDAIDKNASDVHFEPFEKEVNIRFRLNGSLILCYKITREEYEAVVSRIKVKGNMDIADKLKAQDGKMVYNYNENFLDLRISSLPTYYGEKIVIRIMYNNEDDKNLESLSFDKRDLEYINKLISMNSGMILINGPTGSGKSTTLYSILKKENSKDLNIMTIEDPVEVLINGINQVNVSRNESGDITFHSGLRSILRQDPDIIMVGEIRDEETAKIAVRAAITGHKVYSTIHTKSSYEVFKRLKEMKVEEYLIVDSIIGVISQRLIKRLCDKCKKEFYVEEDLIKKYKLKNSRYFKKNGCKYCNNTGYSGRVLVYDLLLMNSENREKIRKYLSGSYDFSSDSGHLNKCLEHLEQGVIDFDGFREFVDGDIYED